MAEYFNPRGLWQPFGAFSLVVAAGDGRIVHLKGQVPLDAEARLVGAGDMGAQVHKTLENINAVLASLGGAMADVISLTHYTTDIEAFMGCGDIRARFFSDPFPATTTVEVKRLYHPQILIEITAIAEIPRERFRPPA